MPMESPGMCCSNGKVILAEPVIPLFLQQLFSNQDEIASEFCYKAQLYNLAFTFTSVGVHIDRNLANARDELGSEPQFLQMYIWDTQNKMHHQTNVIPTSNLNLSTMYTLKTMLDNVNPYVTNFCHISNLPIETIKNLLVHICTNIAGLDQRTFNMPTASQVAALWIDSDISHDAVQQRDIVLHTSIDQLIRIAEFSKYYDPLADIVLKAEQPDFNKGSDEEKSNTEDFNDEDSNDEDSNDENDTNVNNKQKKTERICECDGVLFISTSNSSTTHKYTFTSGKTLPAIYG
ncbi:22414_t:CDS:2 [Dentiscutata erythropus]|uniref:22414_t:CDS:1 n=1 Tax=Dentiscutata erythropus TaxID=1348616 RepID=A0A9N9P3K4_9GLOM|nr:22414_t:CDS:2 [Dentiscutata erythropus]